VHFQNVSSLTNFLLFLAILTSKINMEKEVGQFWFPLQALQFNLDRPSSK